MHLSNHFHFFGIAKKIKQKNPEKGRRCVMFKKQNYYSVYEYPKESTALSPAMSEPQMYRNFRPFAEMVDSIEDPSDESNGLKGFSISSSTRPFYGSQFNAYAHTWPSESNFSWSQIEVSKQTKEPKLRFIV